MSYVDDTTSDVLVLYSLSDPICGIWVYTHTDLLNYIVVEAESNT